MRSLGSENEVCIRLLVFRFVELLDWMFKVILCQSIIDVCRGRLMICFLLKAKRFEFFAGVRIVLLASVI